MELTNEFRVTLPVERAWAVLTDLERVASCMPGVQLRDVEGAGRRGVMTVEVGPMPVQYEGTALFLDRDEVAHVAVLRAEGREAGGEGTADVTITARLADDGSGTAVSVVTELVVTGPDGQLDSAALGEVGAEILSRFVTCLKETIRADQPHPAMEAPGPDAVVDLRADEAPGGGATVEESVVGPAGDGSGPIEPGPDQPVVRVNGSPTARPMAPDCAAGSRVTKRAGPVLALVAIVWVLKKLLSRTRE